MKDDALNIIAEIVWAVVSVFLFGFFGQLLLPNPEVVPTFVSLCYFILGIIIGSVVATNIDKSVGKGNLLGVLIWILSVVVFLSFILTSS
jgi:hypothetical protein